MTQYINVEEILYLHYKVIEDFGGLHGVRSEHSIASLLNAPKQEVFGKKLYSTIYEQASVYMHSIINDHPFVDGNKRTAVTVSYVFLKRNNVAIIATQKDLEDFAVKVVNKKLNIQDISIWLKNNSVIGK